MTSTRGLEGDRCQKERRDPLEYQVLGRLVSSYLFLLRYVLSDVTFLRERPFEEWDPIKYVEKVKHS